MEVLEGLTLVTAETYKATVEKFGGNTSTLLEETSAYNVLPRRKNLARWRLPRRKNLPEARLPLQRPEVMLC
jgi:hypothetical protein